MAEVKRGDLNDTGIIRVKGLKPDLDFDVFTVQRSPTIPPQQWRSRAATLRGFRIGLVPV